MRNTSGTGSALLGRAISLVGAVVLLALALVWGLPQAAEAQSGVSHFDTVSAGGDVMAGDDLVALDDLNVSDDATVGGDLTVGGRLVTPFAATVTVTMNGVIPVNTGVVRLQAAGAVATAGVVTATATAGQQVILFNGVAQTITISDTGALKLAGNAALGQFDSLTLVFDGLGNWVQVAKSDN